MRLAAIGTVILLAATPAAAQTVQILNPEPQPYGLDPYKPSDAAVLRTYGSTLVAQTPLLQLSQLDPYKPSHAALLRQLGGGIPLWSHLAWYPTAPPPAPLMMVPAPPPVPAAAAAASASGVLVIIVQPGDRFVAPRIAPERPRDTIPAVPFRRPETPRVIEGEGLLRASVQ